MPSPKPLTLIVATTAHLGIGRAGALPWPQLKQEMAYFARVTKRPSTSPPMHSCSTTHSTTNAVIMGRKTWDSIPPRFRPLKGRLNVVISQTMTNAPAALPAEEGPFLASSLDDALAALSRHAGQSDGGVGDVFVIGGSSVYAAALSHPRTQRILLTKILQPDFECDTFFPLDLDGEEAKGKGWRRRGGDELVAFVGPEAIGAKGVNGLNVTEGEVEWEYCLYEREEVA